MLNNKKELKGGGAILAVVLFVLLLFTNSAWAQCPSGYEGPFSVNETLPGGCQVTIWYCVLLGDDPTFYVESVEPDNDDCDGIDDGSLILQATQALILDPAVVIGVGVGALPACNGKGATFYGATISLIVNNCWQYGDDDPNGAGYHFYICPGETAYCEEKCKECMDELGVIHIDPSSIVWDEEGTPGCAYNPGEWVIGVCNDINPCGS